MPSDVFAASPEAALKEEASGTLSWLWNLFGAKGKPRTDHIKVTKYASDPSKEVNLATALQYSTSNIFFWVNAQPSGPQAWPRAFRSWKNFSLTTLHVSSTPPMPILSSSRTVETPTRGLASHTPSSTRVMDYWLKSSRTPLLYPLHFHLVPVRLASRWTAMACGQTRLRKSLLTGTRRREVSNGA